jgi:hypothetical protein
MGIVESEETVLVRTSLNNHAFDDVFNQYTELYTETDEGTIIILPGLLSMKAHRVYENGNMLLSFGYMLQVAFHHPERTVLRYHQSYTHPTSFHISFLPLTALNIFCHILTIPMHCLRSRLGSKPS